ncbi:MAG: hypothetical protein H6741_04310 [Alphaproteobacteria bacterium]|nr:hypothetical protein [Alphaproteobacteria bacterium]
MNPLQLGLILASGPPPLESGAPYGMEVMVATSTTVPVLGDTHVYTRSLLLVEYSPVAEGLLQRQTLCAVEIDDDARLSDTLIPPAFIRSFPVQRNVVQLSEQGAGWGFVSDPGPVHVGFDARSSGGGVPQELDSPGVLDWDKDGVPGATVKLVVPVLGDIELYIAQTGHTILRGQLSAAGEVQGQVDLTYFEQHTLGASNRLFHTSPATRFVPEQSYFRIAPLEAGASCESLIRDWGRATGTKAAGG